jgi:hypothetical protein
MSDRAALDQELRATISALQGTSARKYARLDELGNEGFPDLAADLDTVLRLADMVAAVPLASVTIGLLEAARDGFKELRGVTDRMLAFKRNGSDREDIQRKFELACRGHIPNLLALHLWGSAQIQDPFKHPREQFYNLLQGVRSDAENAKIVQENAHREALAILDGMRSASGLVGVATHAKRFADLAADHRETATKWLVGGAVLAALTVGAAILLGFLFPVSDPTFTPHAVQQLAARALAIVTLFTLTAWAVKNYRAHRHLAVLNRHRDSALQTFEVFVNASATDAVVKNAILQAAAECIFNPTATGYLSGDEDQSPARIVEVLKTFGGAK